MKVHRIYKREQKDEIKVVIDLKKRRERAALKEQVLKLYPTMKLVKPIVDSRGRGQFPWGKHYPVVFRTLSDGQVVATQPTFTELVKFGGIEHPTLSAVRSPKKLKHYEPLFNFGDKGRALVRLLTELSIVTPSGPIIEATASWFQRVLNGEQSTIFIPVCPDYASENERYTFAGLGEGVGLVAKRALSALPFLASFCEKYALSNVRFTVATGDFEADSLETLARVKLSREQFIGKLRLSQEAFYTACSTAVRDRLDLRFITEIGDWYGKLVEAQEAARSGKFTGVVDFPASRLQEIYALRKSLYRRWHGEGAELSIGILMNQAAEYMALATLAMTLPNALLLGVDDASMGHFMQGLGTFIRPVIYRKRVDY